MPHIDLRNGAWVELVEDWIPHEEADALFESLRALPDWEQRPIVAFGKEILQARLMTWCSEIPYRYSGQTLEPRPYPDVLRGLEERASAHAGTAFNHTLLNLYRDGRDHISMHADNEPELGRCPTIAALSLGAERRFVLELKAHRRFKKVLRLPHGSLLVMGGTTQHRFRHAVPRESGAVGERINVTFRRLHGPPGWRTPREERPGSDPTDT